SAPRRSTLSLHDALPIFHPLAHLQGGFFPTTLLDVCASAESTLAFTADDNDPNLRVVIEQLKRLRNTLTDAVVDRVDLAWAGQRSEEHTSELQSRENLVC